MPSETAAFGKAAVAADTLESLSDPDRKIRPAIRSPRRPEGGTIPEARGLPESSDNKLDELTSYERNQQGLSKNILSNTYY